MHKEPYPDYFSAWFTLLIDIPLKLQLYSRNLLLVKLLLKQMKCVSLKHF